MKIRIVCKDKHWVLRRIAEGWQRHWSDCSIGPGIDKNADVNLYLPYDQFRGKTATYDVVYFTHYRSSPAWQKMFDVAARDADLCIAMSKKTAEQLPAEKTHVIGPGIDPQFCVPGPVVFGVVGRQAEANRKRLDIIERLFSIPNAQIIFSGGGLRFKEMPAFYSDADYVLVLSTNEGGPMCVVEAIAGNKPVIAPDVGWAWDWPVIHYKTIDELESIVKKLANANAGDVCQEAQAGKIYAAIEKAHFLWQQRSA